MNADIANIILSKLEDITWMDNKFGLVRAVTEGVSNPADITKILKKTYPVACNLSEDDCNTGNYKRPVPDSKYKSLVYFEDNGTQILAADQRWISMRSNLKLVCWLNGKKLGYDGCGLSTVALMDILGALAIVPNGFNSTPYSRITIMPTGEDVKNSSIFSKYSYDESITQYLMYPFDYFALNIRTDFNLPVDCIPEFEILPEQC